MKVQNKLTHFSILLSTLAIVLLLGGCSSSPPKQPDDLCAIFFEKDDWYDAAVDMNEKYGVPIHVPMAMMYQESSFKAQALPPKDYILFGLIPWGRVSSAYGFSQAKTMTWDDYTKATGNSGADRDDFADAIDFMGWFISQSHRINGVSKWDAHGQYLNYHEGWGGYKRKTYSKKAWLGGVANKVKSRSLTYAGQLKRCEDDLNRGWFMQLFFG
jgi:hypothetical protein